MNHYFFYGTLRSLPILETVIGRFSSDLIFQDAFVPHSELRIVINESFPVIIFDPQYKGVKGTLVTGLNNEDISRILFFEDVEFTPQKLVARVDGRKVEAKYFSQQGVRPSKESWSFKKWKKNEEKLSILTTKLWMELYGKYSAEEADKYWSGIKAEALSIFNLND
jgi:ADP-ribose pyrophosphatase